MLPAAKQQKRSHHVKPVADSRARPITSFFSRPPPPPQIGRPLGPPKKRGRPRQLTETAWRSSHHRHLHQHLHRRRQPALESAKQLPRWASSCSASTGEQEKLSSR